MKEALITIALLIHITTAVNAQLKKDGTPDMRYKANKQTYGTTNYSNTQTSQRKYTNGGQYKVERGYVKKNGSYVAPHLKTTPDNYKWNNRKRKN